MSRNMSDTPGGESRRAIRLLAAFVAGGIAVIYFLIGFHVVTVLDANADQTFGLFAGVAYALGVVLLLAYERRIVWILGAILQVFVIFTYFNLAAQRAPAFEVWGILLRIAQFVLLIVLTYLAIRAPQASASSPGGKMA